jgi:hypothetical protein
MLSNVGSPFRVADAEPVDPAVHIVHGIREQANSSCSLIVAYPTDCDEHAQPTKGFSNANTASHSFLGAALVKSSFATARMNDYVHRLDTAYHRAHPAFRLRIVPATAWDQERTDRQSIACFQETACESATDSGEGARNVRHDGNSHCDTQRIRRRGNRGN